MVGVVALKPTSPGGCQTKRLQKSGVAVSTCMHLFHPDGGSAVPDPEDPFFLKLPSSRSCRNGQVLNVFLEPFWGHAGDDAALRLPGKESLASRPRHCRLQKVLFGKCMRCHAAVRARAPLPHWDAVCQIPYRSRLPLTCHCLDQIIFRTSVIHRS